MWGSVFPPLPVSFHIHTLWHKTIVILNWLACCKVVSSLHNSITSLGWGILHLAHPTNFLYSISPLLYHCFTLLVDVFGFPSPQGPKVNCFMQFCKVDVYSSGSGISIWVHPCFCSACFTPHFGSTASNFNKLDQVLLL